MKRVNRETTVGLFLLVGIACLAYLSLRLGKLEVGAGDYLPAVAEFSSVAGLRDGAAVEIAGVEIGKIDSIMIRDYKAVIRIPPGGKIRDTESTVDLEGLIGQFVHGSAK
jgi:phospholipid/cholesterol/gamma-HCH transport system substrate-binding protein